MLQNNISFILKFTPAQFLVSQGVVFPTADCSHGPVLLLLRQPDGVQPGILNVRPPRRCLPMRRSCLPLRPRQLRIRQNSRQQRTLGLVINLPFRCVPSLETVLLFSVSDSHAESRA